LSLIKDLKSLNRTIVSVFNCQKMLELLVVSE